jgi:hypothetical protein
MPASPKPIKGTAKRERAARKRAQVKSDRLVYASVDARDKYRCRVCLEYRGLEIHRHHIVYRSAGGETTTQNVISLCANCHLVGVHQGRIKISGNADERVVIRCRATDSTWAIWEGQA